MKYADEAARSEKKRFEKLKGWKAFGKSTVSRFPAFELSW
jgi:hypothetical protein